VPPRRERADCIPARPSNNSVDSTSATTMQMQSRRVEDPSSCAQKDTNWASMMDRGKESGAVATLGGRGSKGVTCGGGGRHDGEGGGERPRLEEEED
jgi:hypothetical protein